LFGDAAGAMVVVPETRPDRGILSTHLYTDGTQADILKIPGGGSQKPFSPEVWEKREQFIRMNGREVYKTAVRVLEAASREALERNGYQPRDVDSVIAHQANLRILESVMKRLEIPLEECEINIDQVGNTSSAGHRVLGKEAGGAFQRPAFYAGHSLGEYSALVGAGAMSLQDGVRAGRARGTFMQEAVPAGEGAMAAILGLDPQRVKEACAEARQQEPGKVVEPANYNSPEQTVIAGHAPAVDRAIAVCKAKGAKRALP